jgi:hypothetical protein
MALVKTTWQSALQQGDARIDAGRMRGQAGSAIDASAVDNMGLGNAPACTMRAWAICACIACACSCARRTRSRADACTHLRLIMSSVCCRRRSAVLDCSRPWPGDGGTRRVELPGHYCVQGQPLHACSVLWRKRRHERVANLTSQHRGHEPHAHRGLGVAQQLLFAHVRRAGHLSPPVKSRSARQ